MTEYIMSTIADENLIRAIKQNDVAGVENLLRQQQQDDQRININCVFGKAKDTPLIIACKHNVNYRIISIPTASWCRSKYF